MAVTGGDVYPPPFVLSALVVSVPLFQIVPSVKGVHFKDLKQTLRKEQCDVFDTH